eukprot:469284_1
MISLFMKICIFTVFGIVLALFLLFASRQFRPTSTAQLFDDCDKTVDSKMDLEEARSAGDDNNNENLVGFPIMISPPDPDISETFITLADSIHKYTIKMPNDNDMNMDHDPKAKPQSDKKSILFAALSDSLHKYSLHKSSNDKGQTVEKEKDCENASDDLNE